MSESRKLNQLLFRFQQKGQAHFAELKRLGVKIYSTGGTQKTIEDLGGEVVPIEALTATHQYLEEELRHYTLRCLGDS